MKYLDFYVLSSIFQIAIPGSRRQILSVLSGYNASKPGENSVFYKKLAEFPEEILSFSNKFNNSTLGDKQRTFVLIDGTDAPVQKNFTKFLKT